MVTLTCQCTRGVSPGGESVLICQVPSTPPHLTPGVYTVICQSEDYTLSGRQLRFQWTGSEWVRWHSSGCGGGRRGSPALPEMDKECYWNYALKSWLNKPFSVCKKEKRPFFSTRPQLSVQLVVSKRGFVPKDKLAFDLTLKNFSVDDADNNNVDRVRVELVQKMTSRTRRGQDGKKTVTTTMTSLVQKDLSLDDPVDILTHRTNEIRWASEFLIPQDIMPSIARDLTRKISVSVDVSYVLVFTLPQLSGGRQALKGEAPIVIGRANNEISRIVQLEQVQIEAPPSYSSLLPIGRRSSIESLPPTYEAAIEMMN